MNGNAEPAYPMAAAAASRVHQNIARDGNGKGSPVPDLETLEKLIDIAFWTSLRREETYSPRVSLAFVEPAQAGGPLLFGNSVPFAAQPLTRLAPAVERPGIHLGVARENGELRVWGATRDLPPHCLVLEVVAPGLLVIKQTRADASGKFINIAVLQGDELKVVETTPPSVPDCPELLISLLDLDSDRRSPASVNVLIQLAASMREHGRGGLLLVVPDQTAAWQESMLQPLTYSVVPAFGALVDLMREDPAEHVRRRWREALQRAVAAIAGLTAVDGATVLTSSYELLAFGAKIVRREGCELVSRVVMTEPIEGTAAIFADPGHLGGTRHLSAAQFAHDQRDSIALVASQDGRFTAFGWSPCEQIVHAHRLETLLL